MKARVRLFAGAREGVGCDVVEVELPGAATVADLRAALSAEFPALGRWGPRLLLAVNQQYATDELQLREDADIAGFPPVSGG